MDSRQFVVRRDRLSEHETATAPLAEAPGTVTLRVEHFGFTSNNITYGVLGDILSYWSFFPAPEPEGGVLPVWGFATVERSDVDGVAVGERVYGFLPMASHVVIQPRRVDATGFLDAAPHRRVLSSVYNQYLRTTSDPSYRAGSEPLQALLRPVFATAFFLADYLRAHARPDAATTLISSASSKLAIATAHVLGADGLIGLTSARNAAHVARLGLYERVVTYDDLASLDAPAVLVDIAGDATLRRALQDRLGDGLRHTLGVGFTHWDAATTGPAAQPFFAPAWIQQRTQEWGAAEVQRRLAEAWHGFLARLEAGAWLTIVEAHGPDAVAQIYDQVLAGRARPDHGYLLSM